MAFKEAQKQVDDWVTQYDPAYWKPLEQLARLTEEVGELAREMNHQFGAKRKKSNEATNSLEQELVDVIFTTICIANSNNIDLDKSWNKMVEEKMQKRDKNRFSKTKP